MPASKSKEIVAITDFVGMHLPNIGLAARPAIKSAVPRNYLISLMLITNRKLTFPTFNNTAVLLRTTKDKDFNTYLGVMRGCFEEELVKANKPAEAIPALTATFDDLLKDLSEARQKLKNNPEHATKDPEFQDRGSATPGTQRTRLARLAENAGMIPPRSRN